MDTGEEGEGKTNWEIVIDAYTLPHVKEIADGNLLYNTGNSAQGSVMTLVCEMGWGVRWRSKRERIYVYI